MNLNDIENPHWNLNTNLFLSISGYCRPHHSFCEQKLHQKFTFIHLLIHTVKLQILKMNNSLLYMFRFTLISLFFWWNLHQLCFYLLLYQFWFPRGLVRFRSYWVRPIQSASVADWHPPTTAPGLPVPWFLSLSLSPPQLAPSPTLLIISCLIRDHPPSGPGRNCAISEAADWTRSQPTGASDHLANNDSCSCQSGWATASIFLSVGQRQLRDRNLGTETWDNKSPQGMSTRCLLLDDYT